MKNFNNLYNKMMHQINESSDPRDDYDDAKFMAKINGEKYVEDARISKLLKDCPMKTEEYKCALCHKKVNRESIDISNISSQFDKTAVLKKFLSTTDAKKYMFCDECYNKIYGRRNAAALMINFRMIKAKMKKCN